jgi:Tfp pilus assembly PilM family ATPase
VARELNIDWQQADQLMRMPSTAPWLHQLYEPLEAQFRKLVSEVQQSINQYVTRDTQRKMAKLLIAGNGWKLHGLLKCMHQGG